MYLAPWTLSFLAKTSILRSSDMRQETATLDDLRGLAFMHANLRDASVNPRGPKADPRSTMVRVSWEQFVWQERLSSMIPRTKLLLIDGNREVSGRPFDLEAEWLDATGIGLEKFMVIGFGYFAGALHHTSLTRYFAATGKLADAVSQEDCDKFLSRASATYEQFRQLSAEFRVTDPLYIKTEFNVLNKRPLIAVNHELIVPVPRLLAYRISEGLYFDLMDLFRSAQGNAFLDYFGRLFEHYVGRLLKWTFGPDSVIPEPRYGKSERRGPDWIVLDGETAILFECRSSRLRMDSRVSAAREDLAKDTERIFAETVAKYPEKIRDFVEGRMGIDATKIKSTQAVIVMCDSLFFESHYRDLAHKAFEDRGLASFEDYHLMGIAELEVLSSWNSTVPMSQLLNDRKRERESKGHAEDFHDFLTRYSRQAGLASAHPLLERVQREFFERHFDIDERGEEPSVDGELLGEQLDGQEAG
ncbi:MAG: hypothetical protein HYX92_08115 [Chloroflexi bacterium]|nr:hypothetical protein [Chloroflexota bacterium]